MRATRRHPSRTLLHACGWLAIYLAGCVVTLAGRAEAFGGGDPGADWRFIPLAILGVVIIGAASLIPVFRSQDGVRLMFGIGATIVGAAFPLQVLYPLLLLYILVQVPIEALAGYLA